MEKFYEGLSKFLHTIINVLFVIQIVIMIVVFLTASYWFFDLINSDLFSFAQPLASSVSDFVKLFYDREVQAGGVYIDGSLLLFDILALRIIIYSNMPEKDIEKYCYITLKCCISYFQNQLCTILPPAKKIGNNLLYKDYIEEPKSNGYKSIHLAFIDLENEAFELQIRTDEMNKRAEYDLEVNHHAYKNFEYSDIFPYINFDVKKVNIPGFSIHVCKDPETEKEIVHIEDEIGLKYAKAIEKRVKTYSL